MSKIDEYFFRIHTSEQLAQIIELLTLLNERMEYMSAELEGLIVQVGETEGVEASVMTLLEGIKIELQTLAEELAAEKIDNTKVLELSGRLDASEQALAAAVAEFTPPVP